MSVKTTIGLLAVGAMIALLPMSGGCNNGPDNIVGEGDGGTDGDGTTTPPAPGQNAAFLVTNGTFFDSPGLNAGTTTAELTDTGTAAFVDSNGNIDSNSAAGPSTGTTDGFFSNVGATEVFGDPAGDRIEVTKLVDVGNDHTSGDGFLMVTHQESTSTPGRLQIGVGFGGADASDVAVIQGLQARTNHTATYTGVGQYYAAIGNSITQNSGPVTMDAHFSGAEAGKVDGTIQGAAQTVLHGAPPVTQDGLAFHGDMNVDNPAFFTVKSLQLQNGAAPVGTIDKPGGAGAFFGTKAGGTVFVLTGTGSTGAGGANINVVGAGRASTTDNN